jgi:tetratricopeptide (TPR) repeat protein
MPKRVTQHEIEDISRAKFQLALPRKWVFRDKTKDYGIDGEVELFDNNKAPQGLVFWVQLKATESKEKSVILNVDFNIETLKYYKTLDIPVLLVRYSDYDNSIYIKWIHNIDLFFAKENSKTFRVKLTEKDNWIDSTSTQIEKYLKKIRQLKSGSFSFPFPLSVLINETKVNNISKGILLTQIKKNLQKYSDVVSISNIEDSFIIISLNNNELKINISELSGCSFHSIDLRKEEDFSNGITKDILLGIAVGLIQLQQVEYSGKIIFENNLQSRLLEKPELLKFCLVPLFNSAYFESTLNLVGQVLDNEDFIGLNIITQINLLLASNAKNKKVSEIIENFLNRRLEKAISNSDKQQIGISHYNIGNHLSVRSEFERSIHHYNLARKFAPIYLEQHYYFAEIASMLFRSKKYKIASKLYSKSIELKKDNHTLALYADSLMFEGNYKKAHTYFKEYLNNTDSPIDVFVLKYFCLESILKEHNIESQVRNRDGANKLVNVNLLDKEESTILKLNEALKFDMLSGLAWFNLGITYSENNEFDQATFSFTMAALVQNGDIEAWKNATLCAFNSDETNALIPLIIRTAYFFNREEYLEELYLHFENLNPSLPINQVVEAIEQILPIKDIKRTMPTVRVLNEKGKFESIEELIKGYNILYNK